MLVFIVKGANVTFRHFFFIYPPMVFMAIYVLNQIAKNIKPIKYDESKPFATSHAKQIGFVTDLTWLDFQKLNGIENDCKKILSSSKYIDETRCENICYAISKRIDMLKDLL